MNIIKRIIQASLLTGLLGVFMTIPVFADPAVVTIKCSNGDSVQATRTGTTFTDADYQRACEGHGGYTAPAGGGTSGGQECNGAGSSAIDPLCGGKTSPYSKEAEDALAPKNTHTCGNGEDNVVTVAFDFGCIGSSYGKPLNPIIDIAFAIFRFLSAGVGLVVIGSIIVAGIQYSTSRGDPGATEASIKRITNSVIALLIYIFMFAIANFLVPGGMFIR